MSFRKGAAFLHRPTGKIVDSVTSKLGNLSNNTESIDDDNFNTRVDLTKILRILFNFAYYMCVTPYRFVRDVDNDEGNDKDGTGKGYYRKKVWRPQQVICGVLHILCFFRLTSQIRQNIPDTLTPFLKNPTVYLDILLSISSFLYKGITMKRFWFNGDQYMKVLNFILKNENLPIRSNKIRKRYFMFTFFGCALSMAKVFICLIAGHSILFPVWKWTPSWWLRRVVNQGQFVFCFTKLTIASETPELLEISFWECVLVGLMVFALFIRYAMTEFCDLSILACALTLWIPASSSSEEISEILGNDEKWDEDTENGKVPTTAHKISVIGSQQKGLQPPWPLIYKKFQAIQELSQLINEALGSQVTCYMAESAIYYSSHLNSIILTKDEFSRGLIISFLLLAFNILYVSADICKKMESAKSWLLKKNNMKSVPFDEAYLVLHEAITKKIGIRGSNIFTITFRLLAAFLSLIVTLFIICVKQKEVDS